MQYKNKMTAKDKARTSKTAKRKTMAKGPVSVRKMADKKSGKKMR